VGQDNPGYPMATPESQGISSGNLNKLADIVQGYFEDDLIVGAELVVIKNRHTVLHEVFGWRDLEEQRPMEKNTIFNVRSMSKPFTGAAMNILIDEGLVNLDDKVSDYIPGFDHSNSRSITIEQLLTHRSGLPVQIDITSLDGFESLFHFANTVGERGPQFTPGSRYWYSDAGTDVLGAVVEQASGTPLQRFITERLLEPLGMEDSFSFFPDESKSDLWNRVASLYLKYAGSWTKFWKPDGKPFPIYPFTLGAQTLYSTPQDYARFAAMWMDNGLSSTGKRVLSEDAIKRILTPVSESSLIGSDERTPTGFENLWAFYGQMTVLYAPSETLPTGQPRIFGHSGSDGTKFWCFPEQDLIVFYFTQSRGGLTTLLMEREIDRLIAYPNRTLEIRDEFKPYIGRYSSMSGSSRGEEYEVFVLHDRLTLDIPGLIFFELRAPDSSGRWRTVFDTNLSVSFQKDDAGNVTGARLYEPGMTHNLQKIQTTSVNDWAVY